MNMLPLEDGQRTSQIVRHGRGCSLRHRISAAARSVGYACQRSLRPFRALRPAAHDFDRLRALVVPSDHHLRDLHGARPLPSPFSSAASASSPRVVVRGERGEFEQRRRQPVRRSLRHSETPPHSVRRREGGGHLRSAVARFGDRLSHSEYPSAARRYADRARVWNWAAAR